MSRLHRTHQDHLKGFRLDSFRDIPGPLFVNQIDSLQRVPHFPLEEARRAARLIREQIPSPTPIQLCLSGGVDSEAMAYAFLQEKVPFEPVVFRFKYGFNDHDIGDAFKYLRRWGQHPRVLEVDAVAYFESSQFWEDAQTYHCISPQLCLHIHFLKMLSGCPVLSWNCPNLEIQQGREAGLGLPQEKYWAFRNYFDQSDRAGVPFFFLYTPELAASFLRLPLTRNLRKDPASRNFGYAEKCESYRQGGFPVVDRAAKLTGFEMLRSHYDQLTGRKDSFNELFRRPLEEKMPPPKNQISFIPPGFFEEEFSMTHVPASPSDHRDTNKRYGNPGSTPFSGPRTASVTTDASKNKQEEDPGTDFAGPAAAHREERSEGPSGPDGAPSEFHRSTSSATSTT